MMFNLRKYFYSSILSAILCAIIVHVLFLPATAQDKTPDIRFDHTISTKKQLYGGILRDREGFLWIGGNEILIRSLRAECELFIN